MDPLSWTLVAAIGVIVFVAAVLYFSAHSGAGALTVISISCLPLFFDPTTRSLTLLNIFQEDTSSVANGAIHLSAPLVVLVASGRLLGLLREGRSLWIPGRGAVLGLSLLYTFSIAIGLTAGAGLVGLAFYVQTMLPLIVFLSVLRPMTLSSVSRVIVASSAVTLAVVLAVAVLGAGGVRGGGDYGSLDSLVAVIPQFRSYFSIVPAVGIAFAIAGWNQHRKLSMLFLLLCAMAVPTMWSRTGLAMMGVSLGVAFLARPGAMTKATRTLLGGLLGLGAVLYAVFSVGTGLIGERDASGSTLAASGESRSALALEAVGRVLSSPLVGDSFVPYSDVLAGGTRVELARLFPAHNQYLDVSLRGGVLALVLILVLLVGSGVRSWRLSRTEPGDSDSARFHAGLLAIICSVSLGNLTHLFLVQPWSGVLVFALMGIGAASSSMTAGSGLGVRRGRRKAKWPARARAAAPADIP